MSRVKLRHFVSACTAICWWGLVPAPAHAETAITDAAPVRPLQRMADELPPALSDGLDVVGWVWLSDLQNNSHPRSNYHDELVSLEITKSFQQRVAVTAEGNFIDANGSTRAELEQGFVSTLLSTQTQTMLTVGKFNSNFGIEPRDFWNRVTGTTSLLFSAQPQDLIGLMVTQPLGDTAVTVRPFISADFQGAYYFDQPPSGGVMVEYRPTKDLNFGITNWVGPGFVIDGGRPLRPPFPSGGYGYDGAAVAENWQGPNLTAERRGTLYFVEAKATWRPVPDLMLAAEYLLARTDISNGSEGWHGWCVLADFDVDDRLHIFGRWSALDDSDWLVTGTFQKCQELSTGAGYQIFDGVELRGEYRHDFSNVTPDFDSVSVHLTFAF
jgi:Putative beta-barrel porin-2, OmpL-like. bbp2